MKGNGESRLHVKVKRDYERIISKITIQNISNDNARDDVYRENV